MTGPGRDLFGDLDRLDLVGAGGEDKVGESGIEPEIVFRRVSSLSWGLRETWRSMLAECFSGFGTSSRQFVSSRLVVVMCRSSLVRSACSRTEADLTRKSEELTVLFGGKGEIVGKSE